MSKKKKKSSKNLNKKPSNLNSQQNTKLRTSPFVNWTRWFLTIPPLVAVAISIVTSLFTNWWIETPDTIKWAIIISGMVLTSIRVSEASRGHKNNLYQISRKAVIIDTILVGILFVITAIPALLGTGTIEKLANWIYPVIPIVNQTISKIVAWFLTFAIPSVVSGVIGNFVYDALKKAYNLRGHKES